MIKTSNKNITTPKISEKAIIQIKNILQNEKAGSFVRILVDSGGCSGFSYKFSIDDQINYKEDMTLLTSDNKHIFVTDKVSIGFIKDSNIDWIESITNSQFVVNNPLAKSSCGCGSSFSI